MAVEVLDDPGVDHISVCAGLREDLEYLPCEVVGRREQNGVTVLHLRFGAMNDSQSAHARQLIEDIERAIAA
ncbi:MAG: hypothetical protein U5Q44_09440 [Dehalococcoidia bacterium]|nr:hypothetical protein [Dehalococcoidia bacterium]